MFGLVVMLLHPERRGFWSCSSILLLQRVSVVHHGKVQQEMALSL